ncbi:EamA family transporter [Candidatus Woesearchaeota archaeon]|nr:EamA family transporter [Candidatus Woesearchaeota archaeon]
MLWLVYSLLTAVLQSVRDVLGKAKTKVLDEYVLAWSMSFVTAVLFFPLFFFIEIPSLDLSFWFSILVSGTINIVAFLLYTKALKHDDLSLSMPMLCFTPALLLITSPFLVGEFPSLLGIGGVLLIVLGTYIMKMTEKGFFSPFKALLRQKGPRYMLLVAVLFSISANVDKIGLQHSSLWFWIISVEIFIALGLTIVMMVKSSQKPRLRDIKHILPLGLVEAGTVFFHMSALGITFVAYLIAIKRTSALLSTLWGHFFFKEKEFKERITGALFMVLGVTLIAFSG